MKKIISLSALLGILTFFVPNALAATAPNLGGANVATFSSTSVSGQDGLALSARTDLSAAINSLNAQSCTSTINSELGGQTLTPGVYCVSSNANLSGDLTLDANGDTNAIFVFKIPGTLTTGSNARIVLTDGARAENVFFNVGGTATLGTNTSFQGTILSPTSIALGSGATIQGRALSLNGSVTGNTNGITCTNCIASGTLATLTVTKIVINDNGGTATPATTNLFANGLRVQSGVKYYVTPGTYTLSEIIVDGNYLPSPWSGDCNPNGTVTLSAGQNKTCTVTNNDIGPGGGNPGGDVNGTSTPGLPNTGSNPETALPLFSILALALGFAVKKIKGAF